MNIGSSCFSLWIVGVIFGDTILVFLLLDALEPLLEPQPLLPLEYLKAFTASFNFLFYYHLRSAAFLSHFQTFLPDGTQGMLDIYDEVLKVPCHHMVTFNSSLCGSGSLRTCMLRNTA